MPGGVHSVRATVFRRSRHVLAERHAFLWPCSRLLRYRADSPLRDGRVGTRAGRDWIVLALSACNVSIISSTLMEHYGTRRDGDALMEVVDLALAANPRDPVAMV